MTACSAVAAPAVQRASVGSESRRPRVERNKMGSGRCPQRGGASGTMLTQTVPAEKRDWGVRSGVDSPVDRTRRVSEGQDGSCEGPVEGGGAAPDSAVRVGVEGPSRAEAPAFVDGDPAVWRFGAEDGLRPETRWRGNSFAREVFWPAIFPPARAIAGVVRPRRELFCGGPGARPIGRSTHVARGDRAGVGGEKRGRRRGGRRAAQRTGSPGWRSASGGR